MKIRIGNQFFDERGRFVNAGDHHFAAVHAERKANLRLARRTDFQPRNRVFRLANQKRIRLNRIAKLDPLRQQRLQVPNARMKRAGIEYVKRAVGSGNYIGNFQPLRPP